MKTLSDNFRILGSAPRLNIITLLAKSPPLCVNAIREELRMGQSAVSQHLRVLKMAGWVRAEKRGYWVHYSLNRKKLDKLRLEVEELASRGARSGEKRACQSERSVVECAARNLSARNRRTSRASRASAHRNR